MPAGTLDPALMIRLQQLVAARERAKAAPGYPLSTLAKATGVSAAPPLPVQPGKTRAESEQFFDQILNMGMSGGAGVTNFASKAERELASKAALTKLYDWLVEAGYHPPDAAKAVNKVSAYPRVAAHIQEVSPIAPKATYVGQLSPHGVNPEASLSRLSLKPYQPDSLHTTPQELTNSLFHELTHQAQKLGAGGELKFQGRYARMPEYFEHTARRSAGDRAPSVDSFLDWNAPPPERVNLSLFDALFKRK